MSEPVFLDTSVLVRFLLQDDASRTVRSEELLGRVFREEERVVLSPIVVYELVFVLLKTYRLQKAAVVSNVRRIIRMHAVELQDKQVFIDALNLWDSGGYSFGDAYNTIYARSRGLARIYSWDQDFDRMPGLSRIEP